ncbi:hypothetical protein Btru_068175 [Bulinus truncatus]|nr:hypothetical protein Btru_068175 [Bulinus truncatus]
MYRSGQSVSVVNRMDVQLNSKSTSHKTSPLTVGAPLNVGTPLNVGSPLTVSSPLCEDGRAYVTDPVTGRQICMCNLGVGADVHFPHVSMGHEARKQGVLPGSGPPHCLGFDSSAFCSPVIRGLPLRPERMPPYMTAGLPGHSMTFDPSMAGHPYGLLYPGMDMNGPMRKAATRETTGPLKAWLNEHKKNPYPTKAEKIMLAIITRMTLTQVSTWFANARRRLKKENKLYPADRENRPDDDYDDDDDDVDSQKDGSGSHRTGSDKMAATNSDNEDINVDDSDETVDDSDLILEKSSVRGFDPAYLYTHVPGHAWASPGSDMSPVGNRVDGRARDLDGDSSSKHNINGGTLTSHSGPSAQAKGASAPKPKIWSISEIIGTNGAAVAQETSDTQGSARYSRPMPHLVIPSPYLPGHLSSSPMNPSPLLSTFSSSLAASHSFHQHQLAGGGVAGLFFPLHEPLSIIPSTSGVAAADHAHRLRHHNEAPPPADKSSPTNSYYNVSPKKEFADNVHTLEHTMTLRNGISDVPEKRDIKVEDNSTQSDLARNFLTKEDKVELGSSSSHKLKQTRIMHEVSPSHPHISKLGPDRSKHHLSASKTEFNFLDTKFSQKETTFKSESLGESALNLQKSRTSEN